MKTLYILFFSLLLSISAFAQTEASSSAGSGVDFTSNTMVIVLLIGALILLLVSLAFLRAAKAFEYFYKNPIVVQKPVKTPLLDFEAWAALQKEKPSIWTKILGLRPLSEEKDIAMEHTFDDIVELNNPTPGWFMFMFYGTIIFAFAYMMYYHVLSYGPLQEEEYTIEMEKAKVDKLKYLATSAGSIDENSVKITVESGAISAGQAIFNTNCVACHGDKAQGIVGPNLTDEFWLHGGKINNVFKTIKYGIPEKGMISWEKTLSPKQISEVSNFVMSLKGSKPANAKAPQGDKEG